MASLDFEREQQAFRNYYDRNRPRFDAAMQTHIATIDTLLEGVANVEVTRIEGRIKDREECLKKFQRKYRNRLEAAEQPYAIKNYLTDLIGIRVVCLYEDQIAAVAKALEGHFRLIEITDKIEALESTEASFGYKGLHMDLAPVENRAGRDGAVSEQLFEVQIRSLIQDAWSVLDHKIKYKKSIPSDLKRRINLLSALFELADREFKEIRNATSELLQQATADPLGNPPEQADEPCADSASAPSGRTINAFSFLRIAGHFFKDVEFTDFKVDNFVQDILKSDPNCRRADLHKSLMENLKTVRDYRDELVGKNPEISFGPYTMIRHCLYLYNPEGFGRMLYRGPKERFAGWIRELRPDTPA